MLPVDFFLAPVQLPAVHHEGCPMRPCPDPDRQDHGNILPDDKGGRIVALQKDPGLCPDFPDARELELVRRDVCFQIHS